MEHIIHLIWALWPHIRQFCFFHLSRQWKIAFTREKWCVLNSYKRFLIHDNNIRRIRVYSLHDPHVKPCSFGTCTEKVLSLYEKCCRLFSFCMRCESIKYKTSDFSSPYTFLDALSLCLKSSSWIDRILENFLWFATSNHTVKIDSLMIE